MYLLNWARNTTADFGQVKRDKSTFPNNKIMGLSKYQSVRQESHQHKTTLVFPSERMENLSKSLDRIHRICDTVNKEEGGHFEKKPCLRHCIQKNILYYAGFHPAA